MLGVMLGLAGVCGNGIGQPVGGGAGQAREAVAASGAPAGAPSGGPAATGTMVAGAAGLAVAHASAAPAGMTAASAAANGERNGFGENLRPVVSRKTVLQRQPYAPIKKLEEGGQIPEIEMFVGESRVFPAPNVGRIAVGNGQIMSAAALDKKEIIVFANGTGTSSLFVWNEDGRYQRIKINIIAGDTSRIAREIAAFLAAIPHAKASIVGDKVIVEGDNLNDADMAKIDQLEKRYPQLVNFTNRVGWEQMVMMDVKVVEFPKSELRDIGLKWGSVGGGTLASTWSPIRFGNPPPGVRYNVNVPAGQNGLPITAPGFNDGVPLPSALNLISGFNLGLSAQLNLLEQEGKASVLAEPQLSARNGAKASFLAGGEFPYSVSNINGVTIIFKPYGIKLDITPKVDHNGVIRATIQAEVSSIDASVNTIGGPALLSRKIDTEFNVKSGETIVLAGLLQRNASTDIDKVPLLGDLPVLGALFRSKRFQNKETELVVFVTPTIVDSRSPGLVDRVNRTSERLEQQMGRQPYLSSPLQPGAPAADFNRARVLDPKPPAGTGTDSSAIGASPAPNRAAPQSSLQPLGRSQSVSSAPVATPPAALPLRGSLLQVIADRAQLRAEPDGTSPALLQLERGAVVQLSGRGPQPADTSGWRPIVVGTVEGWIDAGAVEPLRLMSPVQANQDGDLAAPARQGKLVGAAVVPGAGMPSTVIRQNNSRTDLPRFRVLLDGLAMRAAPDVNAQLVTRLDNGALVEGLPQQAQGYWSAVQLSGKRGWVPTQWLLPQSALAQVQTP
ncbi:MAG: pilus assembly protein N-terminal domain-containing protein [Herminiimonas sp.]|nr:pilus assembly protein N-terminal domain-containing protein [Herminiimonas sp.]